MVDTFALIMEAAFSLLTKYHSEDMASESDGWNMQDVFVGKSEGKRPHGILRSRREDTIKTDLQE
jgi:hypothetical protein